MLSTIAKEDIPFYTIVPAFVDNSEQWKSKLEYALRLGNEHKGKTTIKFEKTQVPREVETTIWSLSDNFIELKGGLIIPLDSIIRLHF